MSQLPSAPFPPLSRPESAAAQSAKVFDNLVTLCALAASLAYCAADARADLAVLTVTAAGLAWVMRKGARARGRPAPNLPGFAVNLLVLAAIVRAAWYVLRGQATGNAVVSDLSEFLIIIQLIKLFDRKNPRDDVQMLALTLFVAIGSILTANSLLVGLLIFVYTPLITGAAMSLQVDVGLRRLAGTTVARGAADGPGRSGHFRATVAAAVIGSLVFAGLAFVLLPRGLGRNTLGAFGRIQQGTTVGFTNTIRLGQPGFLRPDDETPVMDVAVLDRTRKNIGDQMRSLHLRGSVSNTYDTQTRQWDPHVHTEEEEWEVPRSERVSPYGAAESELAPTAYQQVVTMRGGVGTGRFLFSEWRPRILSWDAPVPVTVYPHSLVFERSEGGKGGGQFRYTVWTEREAPVAEDRPVWVPRTFAPGGDPSVARIYGTAADVLNKRGISLDPRERSRDENRAAAAAIQAYLRDNATYSLEMVAPPAGTDPIEFFLYERRQGHCEYFASAFVAMCQSVGLPARMALGFLATEYNGVTGQFVVRASNAHAWAEVRIDVGQWVTFDPSPPSVIEQIHAPGTGILARIKRAYEAVDFAWNSLVVSFDEQRRSSLLGSGIELSGLRDKMSSVFRGIDERVKEITRSATGAEVRSKWWTYAVFGALGAATLALVLWRKVRWLVRTRRGGRGGGLGGSDPLASDLHRRLLRALSRAEVPKPAPTPTLSHVRSLAAGAGVGERGGSDNSRLASAAEEAVEAVYRSRFAGTPLTRERWRALSRALDEAAISGPSGKSG